MIVDGLCGFGELRLACGRGVERHMTHELAAPTARARVRTPGWILLAVAVVALIPRLYLACTTTFMPGDEDRGWIPLAASISLAPNSWHAPLRGTHHGALPAYGVALGRLVLGKNEIGSRGLSIVFGVATVVLCFLLVRTVGGSYVSAWAAALLLAANEYHVHASVLAGEKAYYLFFAAVSLWCFVRFLQEERARWLYATAGAAGAAFLSKELAALLLPVFLVTLLATRHRRWLTRREPYIAVAIFVAVIVPDLWANATSQSGAAVGYRQYLSRVSSLGFTYQPFVLYGREVFVWAFATVGRPFHDNAKEYAASNFLLSLIIAGGVLAAIWRSKRRAEPEVTLFLVLFAFVIMFFTFVGTRLTTDIDAFVFFWADLSLIGGVLLGGLWFGRLQGRTRGVAGLVLLAGMAFSAYRVFHDRLGMASDAARAEPDLLEHAPGMFRDVAISFNHCPLCQQPRVELVSIRAKLGNTYLPEQESASLIADATFGADDRLVRLESSAAPFPTLKMYVVAYRLTSRDGTNRTVSARVDVLHERPPRRRRRVW